MNTTINCLIVDDEPLAINVIKRYINQLPSLTLVASCDNALTAFDVLKNESIDLIFLDIHLPQLTGIAFAKSLQNPPAIIFTTAYRNYAVESYELAVVDYLLKPISFARFLQAVDKFMAQHTPSAESKITLPAALVPKADHLFVNANKKYVKIAFIEIDYIESVKDYIRIHLPNKSITTKDRISAFAEKLPDHFLRVHRSFIVNTKKITAFTALDIELGEREIPIGNSYKTAVLSRLK